MSQLYMLDRKVLWNPSNGASEIFLRQTRVFEAQIGAASGIGPIESDESHLDLALFEEFVSTLLEWRGRTNHAIITALSDGFIATCLVLAARADARLRWPGPLAEAGSQHDLQVGPHAVAGDGWWDQVREQAGRLAGFMPHR